jgi:hypothetical protein
MLQRCGIGLSGLLLAMTACMSSLEPGSPGTVPDATNVADQQSNSDTRTSTTDGGDQGFESERSNDAQRLDLPQPPLPDMSGDTNSLADASDADDACDQLSCALHSHCEADTAGQRVCVCDAGYFDLGAGCVTPPEGDPATRTPEEVCAMWRVGQTAHANVVWTGDRANECDLGVLNPVAIADAIRRVNVHRWLSGLGPVTDAPNDQRPMQECAAMQNANPQLSHQPTSDWDCYTDDGAASAGRANLSRGYRSPADALDGSMKDANTASLGHRRWLLNGPLGKIGIGHRDRATCIGVQDYSASSSRPWTAYPNPGPSPTAILRQAWSIQGSFPGDTATVTRESDGADMPIAVTTLAGRIGSSSNALRIDRTGWNAEVGETYQIQVGDGSLVAYRIEPVDCGF